MRGNLIGDDIAPEGGGLGLDEGEVLVKVLCVALCRLPCDRPHTRPLPGAPHPRLYCAVLLSISVTGNE